MYLPLFLFLCWGDPRSRPGGRGTPLQTPKIDQFWGSFFRELTLHLWKPPIIHSPVGRLFLLSNTHNQFSIKPLFMKKTLFTKEFWSRSTPKERKIKHLVKKNSDLRQKYLCETVRRPRVFETRHYRGGLWRRFCRMETSFLIFLTLLSN